jgi:hypothetical protein
VESQELLPKRVVDYIHEIGVRALDHLAEDFDAQPAAAGGEGVGGAPAAAAGTSAPTAVRELIDHWKSMSAAEKELFVERVASSVVEVVAASATLPLGLKLGKRAAKATKKVIKRETKKLRKAAKTAGDDKPKKNGKRAGKSQEAPKDQPEAATTEKSKGKKKKKR